jgi:hypothetical protein
MPRVSGLIGGGYLVVLVVGLLIDKYVLWWLDDLAR